jgi:hypothetical protein
MAAAAAAAAAALQALRAQQQQDFTTVLMNVMWLTPAQAARMNQEVFANGNDLTFIDEDTLLEIFPEQPRNNWLAAMVKMRLKAFRVWAI